MNVLTLLTLKKDVIFLSYKDTLRQGVEKFKRYGYTALPVLDDDGRYIGTIAEGDLLKYLVANDSFNIRDLEDSSLLNIMRGDFNKAVSISVDFEELLKHITDQNFVPVVDDRNVLMGIITRKTIINALLTSNK